MKKFLVALTLFCTVFTATALASDIKVTNKVLSAFNVTFSQAENVEWTMVKNIYQAKFIMNEQQYSAYFDEEGKMLVLARFIAPNQLPTGLKNSLKEQAGDDVISFVFELNDENGTHYYATLQRGEKKEMLQSVGSKKWAPYTKVKM